MNKCRCPQCESSFTFDQMRHEGLMRDMVDLASFFGQDWNIVNEYIDCFRGSKLGSMTLPKRMRLLTGLKPLFSSLKIEHKGKVYRVTKELILKGILATIDAEKTDLKNHNYLKTILVSEGAERISAQGETAKEEGKREGDRQQEAIYRNLQEKEKEEQGEDETENRGDSEQVKTAAEFAKSRDIDSLAEFVGKGM